MRPQSWIVHFTLHAKLVNNLWRCLKLKPWTAQYAWAGGPCNGRAGCREIRSKSYPSAEEIAKELTKLQGAKSLPRPKEARKLSSAGADVEALLVNPTNLAIAFKHISAETAWDINYE